MLKVFLLIKYNEKRKKKKEYYVRLNKWVTSSCSNTALIAFVTGHLDVTFVTPPFTPAFNKKKNKIIIDKIIKK